MKDIQNEEWLDSLTDDLREKLESLDSYVILSICKRIGVIAKRMKEGKTDVKTATEYAAQDIPKMKKEIEKTRKFTQKEIDRIFNIVAAANVDFANDFYTYRGIPNIKDYEENPDLKPIVNDTKEEEKKKAKNISKTTAIGFSDKDGRFHTVREQYISIVDKAIEAIKLGEKDFYSTMRPLVKQLAKSGLRTVDFDTGYKRRIDSQIEMNIRDGIRQLNSQMQDQVGKEFGADGVEISAHSLCAPDHQDIQGRQYTKEEFEKINNRLERKIGERNCKHFKTPIIIGVSKPIYSERELREINKRSNENVSYKGKTYTRYEASQVQRRYESALREAKMERDAAQQIGDDEEYKRQKTRITALSADYRRFSKAVDLRARPERTR